MCVWQRDQTFRYRSKFHPNLPSSNRYLFILSMSYSLVLPLFFFFLLTPQAVLFHYLRERGVKLRLLLCYDCNFVSVFFYIFKSTEDELLISVPLYHFLINNFTKKIAFFFFFNAVRNIIVLLSVTSIISACENRSETALTWVCIWLQITLLVDTSASWMRFWWPLTCRESCF